MPTFLNELPLHPLIVHAVVVLVPLAVVSAIVVAVWPKARRTYGWFAVGFTALATVSVPLATSTGEGLEHRLPRTDLIRRHAELGDQLLVFVAGLLVTTLAVVLLDRYRRKAGEQAPVRGLTIGMVVAAVLTVGLGVTSAVQVYRIGDSGATAVWSGVQYTAPTGRD